jgi:hypothetical protein
LHEGATRKDLSEVIFLIRSQVGRCLPQGAIQTTELTEKHHETHKKSISLATKFLHHFKDISIVHLNLQRVVFKWIKLTYAQIMNFPLERPSKC